MTNSLNAFLYAERQQESGGNYSAVNASSGALGAYQVMPANVASWTERALGHSLTPQQFLASKSAQDAVANTILGGYYSQYGPAGAAAMWYSGQPNPNASYGSPPVSSYVASVLAIMGGSAAANAGSTGSGGGTTATDASTTTASSTTPSDCLWSINIPGLGSTCIITTGQGRAITGALLLMSAVVVGGAGVLLLAAYGLKHSGALETAAHAAGALPGGAGVAGRLVTASNAVKAPPQSTAERRAGRQREQQRQVNEKRAANREQRAAQAAAARTARKQLGSP